ncbi:MAG: DHA2 family efflux MFS transporter permease subunit, partial [Dongia sp.]
AAAIMTAPVGWIASRFGKKRFLIISLAGFTMASMLCGTAQSLEQMIAFRLVQGMFGAALGPLSQAVMLDMYPPEKRGNVMAIWGMGIMLGPILGPTVGGYLTDAFSWRWVFYVNVPFGIAAVAAISIFFKDTARDQSLKFDWFGFAALSVGLAAIQLMLDRGTDKDWFSSTEIVVEAVVAGLSFYMFMVHMLTHEHPFITPRLFKDRNLVTGLFFIFLVGIVLLATMALLPPFLQNLKGYPVITVGFVLAPRGIGTMIAMLVVGRMVGRVDTRALILLGLLLTAYSLWQMVGFNLDTDQYKLVESGIIQGFGLGFIFVPLSTITFSTLDPRLRTEAAGLFSLLRNIGSSIGISVVTALLSESTQINHAILAEHVTPFNPMMQWPQLPAAWSLDTTAGMAALNGEVTRQAATIAYLNDFQFMMWVTLAAIPLLVLLRRPGQAPQRGPSTSATAAALE